MGRDCVGHSLRAVGKVGGDEEYVLAALFHELEAFDPAGNHAVEREGGGLATAYGAVEDGAVEQAVRCSARSLRLWLRGLHRCPLSLRYTAGRIPLISRYPS